MLFSAALTASTIAPARADPSAEPLISVTSTELPKVTVPILLDPGAEPILTSSDVPAAPTAVPTVVPTVVAVPVAEDSAAEAISIKPTGNLSAMVAKLRGSAAGSRELECLATGIYFESKSEPLAGQLAVGEVIINRAKSGRFAKTVCGVLTQRGQFSFVRGGSLPFVPRTNRQWQTAVAVAKIATQKLQTSAASNALFFHARYVSPRWRLKRVASIGNHIFYR